MRVASVEDTLRGKISAYSDKERLASKRQKDLLDIARLTEHRPQLRAGLPEKIRKQLME